ncbi:MAG: OmpA family protein [Gammaproteobacteria bacterium]|nr:OmpA family protein [Gammaproteobacteria bacterium]
MNIRPIGNLGIVTLAGALAAGCVTTPADNPAVSQAQRAYNSAVNDAQIVEAAPFALREAEDALRTAERLAAAGAEQDDIDHHGYIAEQRVAIARELAELEASETEIMRAEGERQQILLEARTQDMQRATELAEQQRERAEEQARAADMARLEAEQARDEARELARQAQALSQQVRELEARETERGLVLTLGDLLFDTGQATLSGGGAIAVDKLAKFLKTYPERNVLIEGFTDSTGDEAFNQDLSERRALAVQGTLLTDGIDADRMRITGYGEQFPIASNDSVSGRAQNRRVEVIISDPQGSIPERTE